MPTPTVVSVALLQPCGSVSQDTDAVTITDRYRVQLTYNTAEARIIALTAAGIPAIGSLCPYSVTPAARVRRKSVDYISDANSKYYIVTVEYDNSRKSQEDAGESPATAPWLLPASYDYGYVAYDKALEKDLSEDETPILNSYGDPFDPPITTSLIRPKITIKRDSLLTGASAVSLINTCNSDSETINGVSFSAGKLRLLSFGSSKSYWESQATPGLLIPYYSHTIEVEAAAPSETSLREIEVLDAGYRHEDTNGTRGRDTDEIGSGNPGLVRLDGTGKKITDPATASQYKTFVAYSEASWTGLDLE